MLKIFNTIKTYRLDYNNKTILDSLRKNSDHFNYSHKINGRWENQYLDYQFVPEIKYIFQKACQFGKDFISDSLIVPNKSLGLDRDEFWFNIAKPGESTGWHDHKEGAVLSGVYYLNIPKESGDIQFRFKENNQWDYYTIKSKNNKLILFNSNIEHSVTKNRSNKARISLAFNLYTLPLDISFEEEKESYSSKFFF